MTDVAERDLILLSIGTTFALIEQAIVTWDDVPFDDEEIEALLTLPEEVRMKTAARLIELAEHAREALRDLDGRILQLTASQQDS